MKAVIMAGGMGTRIASVRSDVPKPMIEIAGKPILQYQIENLRADGITDITLVVGHLGSVITDYFGDGAAFGVSISYFVEETPLGTAGSLFKMLPEAQGNGPHIDGDFLLLCGDVIFSIDFKRFIAFHKERKAWASLMAHPNGHPFDSSLLVTETLPPAEKGGLPVETGRVTAWLTKEDERVFYNNRVNAGIQIISVELLRETMRHYVPRHPENPDNIDLDRDVLKPAIKSGKIFAYDTSEYIKDMGTPDRFHETELDIASGRVQARNLGRKQKAIFLDRDGTINKANGFITAPGQFELVPGAAEAIKKINKSEYLAVVVTNQPVIARGDATFEELRLIHDKMETELGKEGAFIDALYFCPHHTDKGFPGERAEYKCNCLCRKPNPGMFFDAAQALNIDLSQSYMIGDGKNDILAGKNAGVKECFLVSEHCSLKDAVEKIVSPSIQ